MVRFDELDALIAKVSGGMKPKLEACKIALLKGVKSAHIINGEVPHSLLMEIFTDKGLGTMIIGD